MAMGKHTGKCTCAVLAMMLGAVLLAGCKAKEQGPVQVASDGIKSLSRDGRVYIAGETTVDALSSLKDSGLRTVIDLRLKNQVPDDEAAAVRKLGLTYIHLPMRSEAMSDQQAKAFLEAMKRHRDGEVMIHCRSANRAGAMYGLYLGTQGNCTVSEAIKRARRAGMRNENLAGDVEKYLEEHRRQQGDVPPDPQP